MSFWWTKLNIFRGDLSVVSAKTASQAGRNWQSSFMCTIYCRTGKFHTTTLETTSFWIFRRPKFESLIWCQNFDVRKSARFLSIFSGQISANTTTSFECRLVSGSVWKAACLEIYRSYCMQLWLYSPLLNRSPMVEGTYRFRTEISPRSPGKLSIFIFKK